MKHSTHPLLTHRHYEPRAEAEHARHEAAVLALIGVPVAAVAWQVWSLLVNGPGSRVQPPRYDGWSAVVMDLPATLLVVGLASAALVLAARAAAGHAAHATALLGLTSLVLLVVLLVAGATAADQVGASDAARRAVTAGAATLTAVAAAVAWRWSGPHRQ